MLFIFFPKRQKAKLKGIIKQAKSCHLPSLFLHFEHKFAGSV
jgi:hypothetical protein